MTVTPDLSVDVFGGRLLQALAAADSRKLFCVLGGEGREIHYGELEELVRDCAARLQACGVGPGVRVAIKLPLGADAVVHLLATMAAGGMAVPLESASSDAADAELLRILAPRVIVREGPEWSVDPALGAPADANEQAARLGILTSGSTGRRKCVVLSAANVLAGVENVVASHGIGAADVAMCCLPLTHINGIVTTLLTPLLTGSSVVYMQRSFSPPVFFDLMRKYAPTWLSGTPFHYGMLVQVAPPPGALSSCRFARSAAAPLSPAILEKFEALYGVPVVETMGLSECAGQVFSNPADRRKAGSVGVPVNFEAEVVDDEGRPVDDGAAGEIRLRGGGVMLGYFRDAESTNSAMRGGWLHTGDLGTRDAEGFFRITGRKKLIAIFSGSNISLVEIEQAVVGKLGLNDVAAVSARHATFGEVVDLYYAGAADAARIRESVKLLLPHPLALRNVKKIDSIPRSASGKVLRYRLAGGDTMLVD